jgi:signal peptidase
MSRIGRASVVVGQVILWVALLGFVALAALPRLTPYDVLIVRGGSMEPTLHVGSIVLVDRGAHAPRTGEIVSFREPDGNVVTHRVVGRDADGLVTRGDANAREDLGRKPASSIVGTVRGSLPFIGFALFFLQQPPVFLGLLLLTGGMLIIHELRAIYGELRRMRRREREGDHGH